MKVIIKETQEEREWSLISPRTGLDYAEDFVAMNNDGDFEYDKDLAAHVCDKATFDWWDEVIDDYQVLEDRVYELKQQYSSDEIDKYLQECPYNPSDLKDEGINIMRWLDEKYGEEGR